MVCALQPGGRAKLSPVRLLSGLLPGVLGSGIREGGS